MRLLIIFIIIFVPLYIYVYINETLQSYYHYLKPIKDRLNNSIVDEKTYNEEKLKIAETIHALPKTSLFVKYILNKDLNKHAATVYKEKLLTSLK